jgi:hypothetical protein
MRARKRGPKGSPSWHCSIAVGRGRPSSPFPRAGDLASLLPVVVKKRGGRKRDLRNSGDHPLLGERNLLLRVDVIAEDQIVGFGVVLLCHVGSLREIE